MYNKNDKQEAIREIKKYLYVIATRVYPQIGRTTIDGQYDDETRASVKEFQRIMGLPESGEVDFNTFTALYDKFKGARDDFYMRDYIVENTQFPVGVGNMSEDVRALHILINELAKSFPQIGSVGTGNFYSSRTAKAVRELRRIFGLDESDEVDKVMFARMLTELSAIRRRDKNPVYADLISERRL